MVADNSTITETDMGQLGGVRPTTAEYKDNSLISYLQTPEDHGTVDIVATRTIKPDSEYPIFRPQQLAYYFAYLRIKHK